MNKYRDPKSGQYVHSPANRNKKLISELYRAFNHFNRVFANGELPHVVITLQNRGRRNAYGWFGQGFWVDRVTKDGVHEINLSAEYLARGKDGLLETLLHEMAHLLNASKDIRDCSSGQYHNKKFKIAAEQFGLKVVRSGTKGWAYTSLDSPAAEAISQLKLDGTLFKGLRRVEAPKRVERYKSLIVSPEAFDQLQDIRKFTGLSQKEAVEKAIDNFIGDIL
tara:strand:+ start:1123 stop:1788 length:666 start_codon:yes stop_codon:yes gene_type:complete